MKRKRYLKTLCYFMIVFMLTLTACGTDKKTDSKADSKADSSENTVSDANDAAEETDTYELEYTNIVLDRKQSEGKLACYFFRGNDTWKTWRGSEHDGDSVLVITPDGTTMLYDCNTPNHGANIVYALQRLGIDKIDYFVNSHPHVDHMGGFAIVAKHIEIGHVYTSAADISSKTNNNGRYYRKMMSIVEERGIPHTILKEGDTFTLGKDVQVKVYNPPSVEEFDYNSVGENEISLLLKLTYGESSYLLGGDIGNPTKGKTEDRLVAKFGSELHADVAKVNHHMMPGTGSSSEGWLRAVDAKIWVGQMSALPDDVEYFRFKELDATILHTSLDGTVMVSTNGDGAYDVQVERNHATNMYGKLDTVDGHIRVE